MLYAAVKSRKTAPVFRFCWNPMKVVRAATWSQVLRPFRKPAYSVAHTQQWDWAVVGCQTWIFTRFFNGYHLGLSPDLWDRMGSHDSGKEFGQWGASFGDQVLQEFHVDVVVTWHCRCTQYCNTETVFSIFYFLQKNIIYRMWPSAEGKRKSCVNDYALHKSMFTLHLLCPV